MLKINKALKTLAVGLSLVAATCTSAFAGEPSKSMLTPDNHSLILIDHQPQMAFATRSHTVESVRNNVTGLAKAAKAFNVPTILTTVAAKSFSGPIFPEVQAVFPNQTPIDRTTMNTWEDKRVTDKVKSFKKNKIVISALWTEVCGVGPVLSAIDEGYEVFFVTDASGGVSKEAHDMAVLRMVQAGAKPITWLQYMLELQRDWARTGTYADVTNIAKDHAGGYGLGLIYATEMFNAKEGH
jgi:nicotinamidase-related amidase